jgi:hypothetical protein
MDPVPPDRGGSGPRSVGEIVIRPGGVPTVPALPPKEPELSEGLGRLLEAARQPHPDIGLGVFLPEHLRPEATRTLARYEQLVTPAAPQRVFDWLAGVNARLAVQLALADVMARALVYTDTLRDIPEVCFDADTRHEAERKFQFFPSAAEVHEVLRPRSLALHAKQHALRRLINAPAAQVPNAPPTQEERETILAGFRARMEAVRAERLTADESLPTLERASGHLSRSQLRAAYAEQANHQDPLVAATGRARLRMLGEDAPEPVREPEPIPEKEDADNPW